MIKSKMNLKKYNIAFFLIVLSLATIKTGYAIEPLSYKEDISPSLKVALEAYLKDELKTDISLYKFAPTDLNSDGIDEYILKSKQCTEIENICKYLIIAEKKENILLLLQNNVKDIMLAGTSSHGVKDILVFQNTKNDFNFDIYMWSPQEKKYILGKE